MPKFAKVGRIAGTFGLKGQVKVEPLTDFLERFDPGARLRCNGQWLTVVRSSWHKGHLLVQFEEVPDLTAAEGLGRSNIESENAQKPPLGPDEYVTADLIGLEVFDKGTSIGKVSDILAMPAHDVIVVGAAMIPAVKAFVKKVDLEGRRIDVELIEGMLEP